MLNKQENSQSSYAQNHDMIGAMKSWWNKSGTWNRDTDTAFSRRVDRRRHLDTNACFPFQGELRSWLLDCPWVEMRKEKNKMDVLLELFWRKQNHEKEEIHEDLFAWATHRDIQKSQPHPYNALQIPTKKRNRGHGQLQGSWNMLRAGFFSEGGR